MQRAYKFIVIEAVFSVIFMFTSCANAADLIVNNDPQGDCSLRLDGQIENGDITKFYDVLGYPEGMAPPNNQEIYRDSDIQTLCLNSPGGSLAEGLAIAEYLLVSQWAIKTRIQSGDTCVSSCAFIFLAGMNVEETESITTTFDRHIEPGGAFGLHAPSLNLSSGQSYTSEDVSTSFSIAIAASKQAYEMSQRWDSAWEIQSPFASPYLMARFLETPPDSMYYIDTVGDAILAGIPVANLAITVRLDESLIRTICDNVFLQNNYGFSSSSSVIEMWKPSMLTSAKSLLPVFNDLPVNRLGGTETGFGDPDVLWKTETHIEIDKSGSAIGYASGYPSSYSSGTACVVILSGAGNIGEKGTLGEFLSERDANHPFDFQKNYDLTVFPLIAYPKQGESVSSTLEENLKDIRAGNLEGFQEQIDEFEVFTRSPLVFFPFDMMLSELPTISKTSDEPMDGFNISNANCDELWFQRNSVMSRNGYCFGGQRGISTFGNDTCYTKSPELSQSEASFVAKLRSKETSLGC